MILTCIASGLFSCRSLQEIGSPIIHLVSYLTVEHLSFHVVINNYHVRWVLVTTAWRVLGLRMEERPPAMEAAVNMLNKQPRTNDKGWSSSLGVGRGLTTLHHKK
jgi:hypothetical protein